MIANPATLKFIGLLLLVFATGFFVKSEMARRQALRKELDELKTQQQHTMEQVKAINANYLTQKQELLEQTLQLYGQLDTILQAKSANMKSIQRVDARIDERRKKMEVEVGILKELLKDGI